MKLDREIIFLLRSQPRHWRQLVDLIDVADDLTIRELMVLAEQGKVRHAGEGRYELVS